MKHVRSLLFGTISNQKERQVKRKGTMKSLFCLLGMAGMILGLSTGVASASSLLGKATFVGTISEDNSGGAYSARLRVRLSSTCVGDIDTSVKDRWVIIRSGRMDGVFAHNGVNMKNAYSTLLSALISGNSVQIDGLPNCSTTATIPLDLWVGQVGLIRDAAVPIDPGTVLHPVSN